MRILITNIYSWNNKGDAAIVLAMLEHVKRSFPGAKITLCSHDTNDLNRYGDYDFQPSILSLVNDRWPWPGEDLRQRFNTALGKLGFRARLTLFALLRKFHLNAYALFDNQIAQRLRAFDEHDLVIACGGGYLITKAPPRKLEHFLGANDLQILGYDFTLAKTFNKPYILFNQSVGPFHTHADARTVRKQLAGARAVFSREEFTTKRLQQLGLTNVVPCADIAFGLQPIPNTILEDHRFDPTQHNIGLTVRRCLTGEQQDRYEQAVAQWIQQRLTSNDQTRCYFMPQVIHEGAGDNDLHTAYRIRRRIPSSLRQRAVVIDRDLHPGQLMHVISRMDLFVGTRMHSNIFALAAGVKTIAIAYEPKTDGIMNMLGLENYVTHASNVTAQQLDDMAHQIENDTHYHDHLHQAIHGRNGEGGVINHGRVDLIGVLGAETIAAATANATSTNNNDPSDTDYRRSA